MSRQLTVVMVIYNSGHRIVCAVTSLTSLLGPEYVAKVVIVDNAPWSLDRGHVAELDALIGGGVEYVSCGRNIGYTAAANIGIQRSVGSEWIVLLNPDVVVKDGLVLALESVWNSNSSLVFGPILQLRNGERDGSFGIGPDLRYRKCINEAKMVNGNGAVMLLRRASVLRVGLLDPRLRMFQDESELSLRLRSRGESVAVLDGHEWAAHEGAHSYDPDAVEYAILYDVNALRLALRYYSCGLIATCVPTFVVSSVRFIVPRWLRARGWNRVSCMGCAVALVRDVPALLRERHACGFRVSVGMLCDASGW